MPKLNIQVELSQFYASYHCIAFWLWKIGKNLDDIMVEGKVRGEYLWFVWSYYFQ